MLPALILAAGLASSPHLTGSAAVPGRPADAHVRHLEHVAHLEYLHWRHLEHLAREHSEVPSPAGEVGPVVATAVVPSGDVLSCTGLEHLWDAVGGNPADAFLAAEIAEAESSGYQYATGPYGERGFWQINPDHGSLSTYDKYGNARAAVLISQNGSDWYAWTTYTSGAYVGRCLVFARAVAVRTRLAV